MKVTTKKDGTVELSMVRGDSEAFSVHMTKKEEDAVVDFPLKLGDTIYFTVKKSVHQEEILLQKIITDFIGEGSALVSIKPEDTKFLPYGTFVYDVQITFADGSVKTIIKVSPFTISEEVTYD